MRSDGPTDALVPCEAAASSLPDAETLAAGLTVVLAGAGRHPGAVRVVTRKPNERAAGARSEIVTCRAADGTEFRLLCKYETTDTQPWSDVAYEARVYRHVVQPSGVSAPGYYGTYVDAARARTWLVLEHVGDTVPLADIAATTEMASAAGWLGQFHAAIDGYRSGAALAFLKVYDAHYYCGYAERALVLAGGERRRFDWLASLRGGFDRHVGPLLARRPTIVHGDYHADNILIREGSVYPVDWEAAGIDLGEADLAFLIDGWPAATEQECVRAYQAARWPDGAPGDFAEVLDAARLCLYVHRLGGHADWAADEDGRWCSTRLRAVAERLGAI